MDSAPIIVKRKKTHSHAHHGGSWKVAYADFVTAMMAFFMVLWIMGLSDQTRTQVAGYFNDPLGFSKTPPNTRNIIPLKAVANPKPGEAKTQGMQIAVTHSLQHKIEEEINHMQSQEMKRLGAATDIVSTKEGLRIEFAETKDTTFFKVGSAELTEPAQEYIADLEPAIAAANQKLGFEGFTDARPYSPGALYDNFDLSVERAISLKHALQADGVSPALFTSVRGYGSSELKFPEQPLSGANRRVAILIKTTNTPDKIDDLPKDQIKKELAADLRPDSPEVAPDFSSDVQQH